MVYKNVPGVRIEEVSLLPPSVVGVETAIPAFIGFTQKAKTPAGKSLALQPTRITSLLEYVENFGKGQAEDDLAVQVTYFLDKDENVDPTKTIVAARFRKADDAPPDPAGSASKFNMYYALQHYFANGGGPCYIISVGLFKSADVQDGEETPIIGTETKKGLKDGLMALEKEDEPTLIVFPEAIHLGNDDYFNIYNLALKQCGDLKDRFTIIDVKQTENDPSSANIIVNNDMTAFRNGNLSVDYLLYGAAYYPYLSTTLDFDYSGKESAIKVISESIKIDGTPKENSKKTETLSALKGSNTLLYNQCLAALQDFPMVLPPSPAMAGIYARVDSERGVWKAPANVGVIGISGPALKVSDAAQNGMNIDATTGKSVNAIRAITGRGTVVWGARTLDGNSNEWRYVNVRRFFNFVEESVKKATYRFVFEPNDANTWVKVRAMIENFLTLQWREGALMGDKPEKAFFVRVGLGQTMTPQDVLEGRMIVEIGMAVVRPAEFIILRFMHKMPEA
ncbi:MAG: phage tail sheath family protein [Phaeodactylibacter sp.]|nr:phage tail sheath family protein [Phaeodactylibacter sp.]